MATTESGTTMSAADIGLLILRIGIAATMIQAGLLKFTAFHTTVGFMETGGWRLPRFAAVLVTAAETAGGVGLLLGFLTPLAACAVIGAMVDAWAVNVSTGTFWSAPFNVPFIVAFAAAALLFTGAGAYSLDAGIFGRTRWPVPVAVGLLVVAVAVALITWIVLNGVNPIHLSTPAH